MLQNTPQESFWRKQIANVQLDLSIAAYTKVPLTWNEDNYIPEFNKLYFIMDGEGYIKTGDSIFFPKPGQLCLLPAKSLQSYGTISENTFRKYWCHFTANVGEFPLFRMVETPTIIDVADPEHVKKLFERLIYWRAQATLAANLHVHATLMEIIALLIDQSPTVSLNTQSSNALDKMNIVLKYIEEHLAEPMTVEQLAQIAHFHPNYFIRIFKQTTDYSPIQYLNRRRMEKAKQLLTFPGATVSAIADTVGLELSYFSRMFKEYTGFSPTEFRVMLPQRILE